MAADAPKDLPRNLKEMVDQLRGAVQASLTARNSRVSVEMPVGFEYGLEGQKAKRKGGAKLLGADDIVRSNRELARLFVGMFEGTGLVPLVLFPNAKEAAAAKKMWDAPGLEARVQALVPAGGETSAAAASGTAPTPATKKGGSGGGGFGGGGGGFGGGGAGKKGGKKAKAAGPPPLTRVPASAEVVVVVAPTEPQLRALEPFCVESGMDKLVIVLNGRFHDKPTTSAPLSPDMRAYFEDGGGGGFETVFCFLTQPLGGVGSKAPEGDPVVLWRAFPGEWVFARKPALGPPRRILERDGDDGRPRTDDLEEAIAKEGEGGGLLSGIFGS